MNIVKNSKLLIVLLSALLTVDLHATEAKDVGEVKLGNVTVKIKKVCLEGYLYAITVSSRGDISITQMFINGHFQDSPIKAEKCKSN